jgi:hypothetical protein
MEDDHLITRAIHNYAYAEPSAPELAAVRRAAQAWKRRQRLLQLATAAVVVLLVGGVIAWIALGRPPAMPPLEPTPSPSATSTPTPTPTPTPETGFPQQTRAADQLPHGGLGDTVEGLTLTDIQITDAQCPDSSRCPGSGTLTVQNLTDAPIQASVFFFVFRNNTPAVGNAQEVSLTPGESTSVTISVQPALADNAPTGRTGSLYSWNFGVELS